MKPRAISSQQIEVMLSGKGLPASLEAERLTLGSAIAYRESQYQILAECKPEWFSLEAHRAIFAAMGTLYTTGETLDRVTLAQYLIDSGHLEAAGGLSYLMELDANIPASLNIDGYMRLLREKWVRRQAITTGYTLIHQAMTDGDDATIARTLERYLEVAGEQQRGGLVSVADYLEQDGMDALLAPECDDSRGITLPWPKFSHLTGVLMPNQMTTLGAPTGRGKSSMMRQIIAAAAMAGVCVAVFSLEMSKQEIVRAMAATLARVNSRNIDRGALNDFERKALAGTVGQIEGLPIYLDDESDTTTAIDAKVRALLARRPVGLVVVDHFHLLMDQSGGNRAETLRQQSKNLRRMARTHNLHMLVLAQYNKTAAREQKDDAPQLHQFDGTEALIQDSQRVWMLHPHKLRDGEPWPERLPYTMYLRKARKGGLGEIPMVFRYKLASFEEDQPEGLADLV